MFHARLSAHESRPGGSDGAWDWTKFAIDERRSIRIVNQNGDTNRQCRGEFTFESVQPTLKLMGFKSARVQARYWMRGVRVGEASHPGPPGDLATLSTAIDSPTGIKHALEFDLTQRDSDSEVVTASCSYTESCVEDPHPQRRLRLLWDPSVPDPSIQRHPEARAVEGLFRTSAARIGSVPAGSEIPRAVRSQRWSPINVPLIWSASGSADSTPVLDWMIMAAGRIVEPINLYEGRMPARDAARTGWLALRQVLRAWYIEEPDNLTDWLRTQGFPGTNPGNHISARAQEFIFGEAIRADARVALLEGVYVQLAIHMGRELVPQPHPPSPAVVLGPRAGFDWSLLDEFQIDEIFLFRVPMLKSCPHFCAADCEKLSKSHCASGFVPS